MNFELKEINNDVLYEIPKVTFPAYQEYLEKAQMVADYISGMSVSADNIKEVKKTLADARRLTDRLNRVRIDMKREILQNYTLFEAQVKEIAGVVDSADKELRVKVRELDDMEREEKRQKLREIWDKRILHYGEIEKWIPDAFDIWLTPQMLNKSTSMKAAEESMVQWIEDKYSDILTATGMGDDYLEAYIRTGNLRDAIQWVKAREETLQLIHEDDDFLEDLTEKDTARFIVFGTKDIKLTEMLLNENGIEYRKEN